VKILYDGYIFHLQKAGGVNRYFSEIISRLPNEARPTLYGASRPGLFPPHHPRLVHRRPPPYADVLRSLFPLWTAGFDLFHPTYYHLTPPLEWKSLKTPVVLTVYDFVFWRYGHLYERSQKLLDAQDAAIRRADLLLCISESTRNDLLERFPECASRCIITPLASTISHGTGAPREHARPYFLYVGARVFYKNFQLAVDATRHLRNTHPDVDLLVVGPPWTEDEAQSLTRLHANQFVHLCGHVSDSQLEGLYEHAAGLLYPSEYEGFGLPVLESMARGTPVIALNTSSIPEVAGKGGILIDPSSATAETISSAAAKILENTDHREALAREATRQAEQFSWDLTARATLEAYKNLTSQ
jgi:glycosyltransferase involved in cell wall biosynthesis